VWTARRWWATPSARSQSLRERSVARLAGVVEGDFRDWDAINAWADGIAAELGA